MDATTFLPPTATTPTHPATAAVDHPGRWIGGLLGSIASIAVAGVGLMAAVVWPTFDPELLVTVGLLGAPVGFVLGRAALPLAREAGWAQAAVAGFGLGWLAPPLGAAEILLGWGVLEGLGPVGVAQSCSTPAVVSGLALLVVAIPMSFIAIVVTIPAGIAWGLATRAVSDRLLESARMPRPVASLGVRHGVLVLTVVVVTMAAMQVAMTPGCPAG